jgi:hypothetical protein
MDDFKKYFYDVSSCITEKEKSNQYVNDTCYLLFKNFLIFELFLNSVNNEETQWYKKNQNIANSFEYCHFYITPIFKRLEIFIKEVIEDDFLFVFAMESLGDVVTIVHNCLTGKKMDNMEIEFMKKIQILQMMINKGIAIKETENIN